MEAQYWSFVGKFGDWVLALGVVLSTFILVAGAKSFGKRLSEKTDSRFLNRILPSVYRFGYFFGFKVAADIAPLQGKLEIWIEGSLYVGAVLLFFWVLEQAGLAGAEWSSSKTLGSNSLNQKFVPLLKNVITLFTFTGAAITILKFFQYDVMSLVAALGVGSLAIGLAAKDTLSHMISGFIVIFDNNIRPGDRINLGGSIGDIQEIGLRSTLIKLADANILVVPNSELVNNRIINQSIPTQETTCILYIRVPYEVPFPTVKTLCLDILKESQWVAQDKNMWASIQSLAEGHQLIQIGFWIYSFNDTREATSEFYEKLIIQFQSRNLTFASLPIAFGKELPR